MTSRKITTTVDLAVGEALSAIDGATAPPETVGDPVLYPGLPEVVWDAPATIHVPARLRAITCPGCGGGHARGVLDPLALVHTDACPLGLEEGDLLIADLEGLRQRRGSLTRPVAGVEADLLAMVALDHPSTVLVRAYDGLTRRRAFTGYRREPALNVYIYEEARRG